MAQLLLIDDDPGTLFGFQTILRAAGYQVITACSGRQGLDLLEREHIDLVLSDLRLPDVSGLEILRYVRRRFVDIPVVVITGFATTQDAVSAMRLGAADFREKPLFEEDLLRTVESMLATAGIDEPTNDPEADESESFHGQPHAATRLARLLVPILDADNDPRTVTAWSRLVYASPGALRTWCRIAGISARRLLVFGRLLRAIRLGAGGRHKPENLLDVIDRRTLIGLLRLAGLDPRRGFPTDMKDFLVRQQLIRDPDTLREIRRTLVTNLGSRSNGASGGRRG